MIRLLRKPRLSLTWPYRDTSLKAVDSFAPARYLTHQLFNLLVQQKMQSDRLSSTFAALADPTRRAILARLASGEMPVTAIAEPFDMSLPAISKHLKVLERAGLVSRGREAQRRPCRLQARPLKSAAQWLEHYRRFWEQSFDRLEDYLRELQATDQRRVHKRRTK